MERRKTLLDYMGHVLIIYGFTMVCMLFFALLFGESAKEYSSFLALGKKGVTTEVMIQFLFLAIIIEALQASLGNEHILKFIPAKLKSICMVLFVFITVVLFIMIFQWFPIGMWQPWAMFILCFVICFGMSAYLSIIKTKMENQKLSEGLERLKKQWKEEEKNES